MAPESANTNQRVTNAGLRKDITYLRDDLEKFTTRIEKCYEDEKDERKLLEGRVRVVEKEQVRLDERVTSSNRVLAGLQVIGSSIAAAIGVAAKG